MPDIIHLLPDSIANQIAAGEVVQRPASAVKELMENAVDAGAMSIQLIIKDAGKALIQVIDNGSGMSETDARMSLERHATSKIRTADDLFRLKTMGFRGEALASIAAVAQLEMKTRSETEELGTQLIVEGSELKKQEPVACEKGTSISVKNLFYNVPARRNFLKSNAREFAHIQDEFCRLALAHPEIAFKFVHGDDVIHDLSPGKLSQRITSLLGKNYQGQLAACQEETDIVKISGYIGRPESAKKTRGDQFLFVNQRFIKNPYLNYTITKAYEGLIQNDSFPFYVLFIEIDPQHIDVNVHPTKTEIKFDDERAVNGVMWSAVKQALGTHNLAPAIDFNADVNLVNKINNQPLSRDQYLDEQFSNSLKRSNLQNWDKLFEEREQESKLFAQPETKSSLRFESAMNRDEPLPEPETEKGLFQFLNKYIVRATRKGLMIIDQELAHERVLFEKFLAQLKTASGNSQQSLFPQTITFPGADFTLIMEMEKEIFALGFRFELFGKNTLLVSGIPAEVKGGEKDLFEGLIEQFKRNQSELQLPLRDNLASALAKKASIKSGQPLDQKEMEALIGGLFACANPNFSPDGKPTFFIFDSSKIENYFIR